MNTVAEKFQKKVIYPIHPRAKKRISEFKLNEYLERNSHVETIEPLGYLDFLQILNSAKLVFTDSGGIQEETCILGVPCVTLRDNTERPETIVVGSNIIAGIEPNNILTATEKMLRKDNNWSVPYGNGTTSQKIIDAII